MNKDISRNSSHISTSHCSSVEIQESISVNNSSVNCYGVSNVNVSTCCSAYAGNICKSTAKIKYWHTRYKKGR